ncbi:MAG: helix-turn-helix transcriptional regulator [Clostridia bacterium]|nr:helix-turn-helix transcriptional regulator [Clostridia bacterium]
MMKYQAEYDYLTRVLGKMRIRVTRIREDTLPQHYPDHGLRQLCGMKETYQKLPLLPEVVTGKNTIYRIADEFHCSYVFFCLPEEGVWLLIGPYMAYEKTREQIMEEAKRYGIPTWRLHDLEAVYGEIPIVRDDSFLFSMLNVFGEIIWGGKDAFSMEDLQAAETAERILPEEGETGRDPAEIMLRMQSMEERYTYENELMQTIAHGQSSRAERMLSNFSRVTLESRVTDPIRNVKNYCIISNTLMRKAAEAGGVHPLHLDTASSKLARRVEGITTFEEGTLLMRSMARTYCRLVRNHAVRNYSAPVRQTITYMENDLTADLSLGVLAGYLNMNASYLSDLFHRETGKTITEYVTELRMNHAAALLQKTTLQIQTVAQHCGISDVNYFSKLFKKQYLVTPRQYRTEHNPYR